MNVKVKDHFIETYGKDETINLLFDVLNAIPSSVFIKNEKLEKIFANTANLDLDERTSEETLGYTDFDIHTPENAAIFSAEDIAVLKEGKIRQNEESKLRKDGRKIHFLTLKNRIPVGKNGYLLVGTNTLINEIKERENDLAIAMAAVERSAADFEAVLDSMPLGISILDENLDTIFVNKANRTLWDVPAGADVKGEPFRQSMNRFRPENMVDDEAAWSERTERLLAAIRQGDISPREARGLHGKTLLFSAMQLSGGKRLISYFDITEQKKAQEQIALVNLKSAEDFKNLKQLLDAMPLGVTLIDENLKVVAINATNRRNWNFDNEQIFEGTSYEDMVRLTHKDFPNVSKEDWELNVKRCMDEVRDGTVAPREERGIGSDMFIFSCITLPNGNRLTSCFDITEQKKAQVALAQANLQAERQFADMKATMDAMKMGVVLLDGNMNMLFVNKAYHQIWKSDLLDMGIGRPFRAMFDNSRDKLVHPGAENWDQYVNNRLSEIAAGEIEPRELTRTDGVTMIFSCTALSDNKRLVCYYDITEQKAAENALKGAEQKAILADRAKSEFLANMSHEIRTPMNGVLGMAELLARTELDTKQKTFTDIIVKSGNALLTIINDILDFSKIDAGQLALDPAPFKLGEAIEDVATLVSARAQEKDLELIVRVDPTLPEHVVGDVGRLRQIVTNLMGNAVKFTERGHVLVDVTGTTDETAGVVSLMFKITDTGMGIPKDKIKQVFEKFSQVDTSSTRRHEGTGLGLAISTKLVALMGGEIGAESEHGEGSTFWFTIALPMHGTTVRKKILPFDVNGARILIIDDNPVNRSILLEQMRSWNFDACAATGGAEGLAVLGQAKELGLGVDVVILDYHMPHMNGADVARAVRNNLAIADLPLILLTSVDTAMQGAEFNGIHINAHLMKPARSSLLFDTIVSVIREARTHKGETIIAAKPKTLLELGERMQAQAAAPAVATPAPAVAADVAPAAPAFAAPVVARATVAPVYVAPVVEAPKVAVAPQLDILVAEDNAVNQIVFTQILESTPFSFEIVDNGRKALEAMKAKRPTIILMDVSMPEMNGLEATHEIRDFEAENKLPRTPIIGVTAHALKGDKDRCLEAGMDDYLSKPISPDMLAAKVEAHINAQKQIKRA